MTTNAKVPVKAKSTELEEFYVDLEAAQLSPLWTITEELLTATPQPRSIPWLWQSKDLKPLAARAMALVPIERGGERRVLSLANPGLGGLPYAAGTLWGAIQCLGPGETAPAHRHSPGAIRFVLEGSGVWTTVDGDPCDMHPGDLILTPSWNWHDHTSSESSMLWFDGLDLPMVAALDAVFFEPFDDIKQDDAVEHNQSEHRAEGTGKRFVEGSVESAVDTSHSPLLVYRWAETDAELSRLSTESSSSMVSLEFVNPHSGASVMPTLSCGMHRLKPGSRTMPIRRTGNTIFVAYQGSGTTVVDGIEMEWSADDMFVVPSWAAVEHEAHETADLFSLGDAPVLRALGLYREEPLSQPQDVLRKFDPSDPQ